MAHFRFPPYLSPLMNRFLFLLLVLAACADPHSESHEVNSSDSIVRTADDYFTALTELKKFNGVVLIFDRDSVLFQKAYNIYRHPDSSAFVSLDHQFDIHSVSKLMAQALLLKLEAEGRLSHSQSLSEFYPDFPRGEEITIKMLVENRSGLPRELLEFEGREGDLNPDEIVDATKKQKLLFEPGSEVQYSNVGYELIYDIIARTYQKSFAQSLVEELFIPIKMEHSGAWFYTDYNRGERTALNHVLRDSLMVQVPNVSADEFKTARIFSTPKDLHRFLLLLMEEPYAPALQNDQEIIAKDGGSRGVRAQIYIDLKSKKGYVILANYDEMPFFDTVDDMEQIICSNPVEIPKPIDRRSINLPDSILTRYQGRYRFADFDNMVIAVAVEGTTLALYQKDEKIGSLVPETETVFFENPKAAESLEFFPNDSGSYDVKMGWRGIVVEGVRLQ